MEEQYSLLEITLPEDLARVATEAAKERGCADLAEYILALILEDLERQDKAAGKL